MSLFSMNCGIFALVVKVWEKLHPDTEDPHIKGRLIMRLGQINAAELTLAIKTLNDILKYS